MKKKKGNYKGRVPKVIAELRRQDIIKMTGEGVPNTEIAKALGITPVGVCKSLRKLRESMSEATSRDFEVYRKGQLAILEQIESSLLENQVTPEVAREWRQIRGSIAELLGLNAAQKNLNIIVPAESGAAFELLRHSHGLDDGQLAKVYVFMDGLERRKPVVDATYFPPEEPKQLEETNESD